MSWTLQAVTQALMCNTPVSTIESALSLELYSPEMGIGVGVDKDGRGVLVLPGQASLSAFETSALRFDPWCDTTWLEQDLALPKSAVLRCRFDRADTSLTPIVAGVITSLIDLQLRFQDAGHAVWVMRDMFADGFRAEPDRSVLLGVLGELAVILAVTDTEQAVKAWHVDKDDRYDFSIHNRRLEVKATTSTLREHRFSSFQLPPLHGIQVWIASVQLAVVEVGESLASLYSQLADSMPLDVSRKLADVITEAVGVPPLAITQPQLDLSSSLSGLRLYSSADVPTPRLVPGSSELRWTAYLDEAKGKDAAGLHSLFADPKTGDDSRNPTVQ